MYTNVCIVYSNYTVQAVEHIQPYQEALAASKRVHSWLPSFAEQARHPRAVVSSAPPLALDFAAQVAEVYPVRNPKTTTREVPELHFAQTELKTFPSYLSTEIHLHRDEKPVLFSFWPVDGGRITMYPSESQLHYSSLLCAALFPWTEYRNEEHKHAAYRNMFICKSPSSRTYFFSLFRNIKTNKIYKIISCQLI